MHTTKPSFKTVSRQRADVLFAGLQRASGVARPGLSAGGDDGRKPATLDAPALADRENLVRRGLHGFHPGVRSGAPLGDA
jgi:hypothetical protein